MLIQICQPQRALPIVLPALLASLSLSSCGSITVTASATDQGIAPPRQLSNASLRRGDQSSPRVLELEPRPDIESIQKTRFELDVTVQGTPNELGELYRYLAHTQNDWQFFAGTSSDRSFVSNRFGGLVSLISGRDSARQSFQRDVGTHLGTGYLMVIENDDRVVPWRLSPARAAALDISTLSRLIFEAISDSTRDGVQGVYHDSLSYVPRVRNAKIEDSGVRARGFGFIYKAKVQRPLVSVEAFVPISLIFTPGPNLDVYSLEIDPIATTARARENLDRIMVRGSLGANLVEGLIRDAIRDAIVSVALPSPARGVPLQNFVVAGLDNATGRTTPRLGNLPFEVVLLPESDQKRFETTTLWSRDRSRDTKEGQPVKLAFLE